MHRKREMQIRRLKVTKYLEEGAESEGQGCECKTKEANKEVDADEVLGGGRSNVVNRNRNT